ncbi:hypothetical protein [uncultured Erythrobacter sp.]|uniref:hypothetical protein n=1 Tax=uncultured Erythrobacter sp. TaxID=263913 RepID=UPI002637EFFF|nr:hypothetical protein [uncultured Erythrobacter sp.]
MSREYWNNCITHFDEEVEQFSEAYFGEVHRKCLLVAAAGFDPRSKIVARQLANILGDRLQAFFVREERGRADANLVTNADANEAHLREIVPNSKVERVDIFGDDGAAVGGSRIASILAKLNVDDSITDIVLDMSALSIGVGFPIAKILLSECEGAANRAFHLFIASNPELDDLIESEPTELAMPVKGFSGVGSLAQTLEPARIWLPQLARGRKAALAKVGLSVGEFYKVCPVVPFPARDPRRADALVGEYENELVNEWQVDPRDLVYVSERNPLDSYRTISTLKERYDRTVEGTYESLIILSPIGSKVMAAGALMAAIEHDLAVHYVETARYEFDGTSSEKATHPDLLVHVLLSGPPYEDYSGVVSEVEA